MGNKTPSLTAKMSLKILALDPGVTTGFCIHVLRKPEANRASLSRATEGEVTWRGGQIGPYDGGDGPEHHIELYRFLASENPDIVVYEAFNYQIRKHQGAVMPGVELFSRELIGVIRLWCGMTRRLCIKQQPSVLGTEWCKDPALKRLSIYTAGEPHRVDATRHMLYYIVHTLKRTDYLLPLRN